MGDFTNIMNSSIATYESRTGSTQTGTTNGTVTIPTPAPTPTPTPALPDLCECTITMNSYA